MKRVLLTKEPELLPPEDLYLIHKAAEERLLDAIVVVDSLKGDGRTQRRFFDRLKAVVERIRERELVATVKERRDARYMARVRQQSYIRRTESLFGGATAGSFPEGVEIKRGGAINSPLTQSVLEKLSPDILWQCGAGILKPNIFNIPNIGTLNVHHGVAPEIRGCKSIFWGLYYGRYDWIGVTVHFIDEGLDTGPVLAQERLNVRPGDDFEKLYIEATKVGLQLLLQVLRLLGEGKKIQPLRKNGVTSVYKSSFRVVHYRQLANKHWLPVEPYRYT